MYVNITGENMLEFIILIGELILVAIIQAIAGVFLDAHEKKNFKPIVDVAGIVICYALLGRFVYNHLLQELIAFVHFAY